MILNKKVSEFLSSNKVCVLTTLLKDGSPHGAAMHFSHNEDPLELYFSTEKTGIKCQALGNGNSVKASVVVGFSEEEWVSVQMDGEVSAILDDSELAKVHKIHYAKQPGSEKYKDEPETLFLKFVPRWWRYTEFKSSPWTILSSED